MLILTQDGLKYPEPEFHNLDRIYAVFEYTVNENKYYSAVNRGYSYCGDLDEEAFNWLIKICHIEQVIENYSGRRFPAYHPISKGSLCKRAFWLGAVKNHKQSEKLKVSVQQENITHRKIRRRDSLTESMKNLNS